MKTKSSRFLAGLLIIASTFVGYGLVTNSNIMASENTNDIITGGVSSQEELAQKYGTGDVGAILAHYGVSSDMVASQNAVLGAVTKSGDVIYEGNVIATGAQSVGREWVDGSTAVKIGSSTVYQRATSAIFKQNDLPAYIYRDADGKFLSAVILDCGNPVVATPKPVKVETVLVCDTKTGVTSTAPKATVASDATIVAKADDCQKPIEYVLTCDTVTGTITKIDKSKVTDDQKVVATESDCTAQKIRVCDTQTWTEKSVTKADIDNAGDRYTKMTDNATCTKPVKTCDNECAKPVTETCQKTCSQPVTVQQTKTVVEQPVKVVEKQTIVEKTVAAPASAAATPAPQPAVLPHTGPAQVIGSGIGVASLVGAGYAYYLSRRGL